MGRTYAGILGPLAFTIILLRGAIDASHAGATLMTATGCLFLFAVIGYIVGRIADSIVLDAVKFKFDLELRAREEEVHTS